MEKISPLQSKNEGLKGELNEFLKNIRLLYKVRYAGYGGYFLFSLIRQLTKIAPSPTALPTIFILGLLIVLAGISDLVLRKTKLKEGVKSASVFYFIYHLIELTFLLVLFHINGNIHFVGAISLTAFLVTPYFSYTRKGYRFAVILLGLVGYTTVVVLEYLGILEIQDVYHLGTNLAKNFDIFFTTLTTAVPVMIIILLVVNIFSTRLENSLKKLSQKEKELQEEKMSLEIKIQARTRELFEERESLDEKVKERTRELERERKELAQRISELERFHKVAVGREIKMRELKKEIEELKKENKTE